MQWTLGANCGAWVRAHPVARESRGNSSPTVIDLTAGQILWTLPDEGVQIPVALSYAGQNPTVRRENLEYDFALY